MTDETDSACILWEHSVNRRVYGRVWVKELKRQIPAHRLAWEKANGPIPKDMLVCHTCDVPACVNVAHLFLGTHTDNARDKISKGRHRVPLDPNATPLQVAIDTLGQRAVARLAKVPRTTVQAWYVTGKAPHWRAQAVARIIRAAAKPRHPADPP